MFPNNRSSPRPRPATRRAKLTLQDRFDAIGCCPDKPDDRDHILFLKTKPAANSNNDAAVDATADNTTSEPGKRSLGDYLNNLPRVVDLRANMPPVLDQGTLSSCVTNSISNQIRYVIAKGYNFKVDYKHIDIASRLAMYIDARLFEREEFVYPYDGDPLEIVPIADEGLITLRSAYHVVRHGGFAPEFSWPYLSSIVNVYPSEYHRAKALTSAMRIRYLRVPNTKTEYLQTLNPEEPESWPSINYDESVYPPAGLYEMCAALSEGHVICMGMPLYQSQVTAMETDPTHFTDPEPDEAPIGGHAVLVVGYNMDTPDRMFLVQNSWGKDTGIEGYFTISQQYVMQLAWDFWTVSGVDRQTV